MTLLGHRTFSATVASGHKPLLLQRGVPLILPTCALCSACYYPYYTRIICETTGDYRDGTITAAREIKDSYTPEEILHLSCVALRSINLSELEYLWKLELQELLSRCMQELLSRCTSRCMVLWIGICEFGCLCCLCCCLCLLAAVSALLCWFFRVGNCVHFIVICHILFESLCWLICL